MCQTPCGEELIGRNAGSARISASIKRSGSSPLMHSHIVGEENDMTDIPSRLFGSNPSWVFLNDTDLLNLFKKKNLFQTRTIGPSSALPTQ